MSIFCKMTYNRKHENVAKLHEPERNPQFVKGHSIPQMIMKNRNTSKKKPVPNAVTKRAIAEARRLRADAKVNKSVPPATDSANFIEEMRKEYDFSRGVKNPYPRKLSRKSV